MNQPLPHVAVVILSWNGLKFLKEYLPSVLKTNYPNYTLYVADNDSTDHTISFLKDEYSEVEIIETGYNAGFAEGYNIALSQINSDYFVLLNQDVAVEPDWLNYLVEKAESDKSIGACQPKIIADKERDYFEYAGASGGFIDSFAYPFCRGRIFDTREKDVNQYNEEMEIAWASGCALFIRADLFKSSGGLDKDFFAHMEEIDLCWRIKNAGYKIYACPKSVVYHLGGGSLNYGNPRKTFLNFRNNLRMLIKNSDQKALLTTLFVRLVLDQASAILFLLKGHIGDFKAVWKAHYSLMNEWSKWKERRGDTQLVINSIKIDSPNKKGFYRKSIVIQYFLKGKKVFKGLASEDFI